MVPPWAGLCRPTGQLKLSLYHTLSWTIPSRSICIRTSENNPLSRVDIDGHDFWDNLNNLIHKRGYHDTPAPAPAPSFDGQPAAQQTNGQYAVTLNGRTANVTGGGLMHVMGADHVWITTSDGKSVGMGTAKGGGQIPDKNGGSSPDKPGDPTQLVDEHGDKSTWTRTFTNVNKSAMDTYLTPGKQTGAWIPSVNDCKTWAVNAIGQSAPHDVYNMHTEQWTHNAVVYADGSVHVVQ